MTRSRPLIDHVFSPPSDSFLASLVNSLSEAIFSIDPSGIITSWNRGAERIFGYSAEEAISRPNILIIPANRIDEESTILARIMRGERIEHHETVRRRKDGAHIEVSVSVSPIVDADGKIIGAAKVVRDITQQFRQQERLKVTLASIGDAVIATTMEGTVSFMNAAAEELTGWAFAEAGGRPLSDVFKIVGEDTGLPAPSPVELVLRDGVTVGPVHHTALVPRHGDQRLIEDSAAPIRSLDGQLVGVVLIFRDVSQRRASDLAARRLAAIVEGSDDAIVGKNLRGIVNSWNPGAERIFGYTAAEMIGMSVTRLLPADRMREEQQILARLQRGERVEHFNTIRVRKNGEQFPVSLTISPIRDEHGRVIGASKIARDITSMATIQEKLERHASELEAKVRERTAKLEDTVAELEAFSYSLSHDMRAPLRAIHSFSEIVLNDYGAQIGDGAEYLRKVVSASGRMDRLIQDVLSFARLSRTEIEVSPIDTEKLAREIIQERPELHARDVVVTVEGPLLPVLGHDASLTQCLTNLLGNAVKFVPPGTKPKVTIFTQSVGDRVRICVCDNGIGISPAGQRRLFAIFQRLQPAGRFEGTGVGLAIVKKAAERMSGTVGVDSAEGQGSTFWVELPRA